MVNLLFFHDLPFIVVLIYFFIGVCLSFLSFQIAYENFDVKKMPVWAILILCFMAGVVCFLTTLIIKGHFGLFLLLMSIIPYLSIRRQCLLGRI